MVYYLNSKLIKSLILNPYIDYISELSFIYKKTGPLYSVFLAQKNITHEQNKNLIEVKSNVIILPHGGTYRPIGWVCYV